MQVKLWGGPLDGEQLTVADPPTPQLHVPKMARWPLDYAAEATEPLQRHHYVYDKGLGRYNYAGDWGS